MSEYGTKYYARIKDANNNDVIVYLKKQDYTGTTSEIISYPLYPLSLTYRTSDKDDDINIHGSECAFSFFVGDTDNNKYDEIFESSYRDWKLELFTQRASYTSVDLTGFTNTGSGQNWVVSGNYASTTLTSFLGAVANAKQATYPLSLQQGNIINVNYEFDISSAYTDWTVTYVVGLYNSSNSLIQSKSIQRTYNNGNVITGITLTATTDNAAYIFIDCNVDFPGSSTKTATITCKQLSVDSEYSFDTGSTYWSGWIMPENLERRYVTDQYILSMVASCGLGELKEFDFPYYQFTALTKNYSHIHQISKILDQTNLKLPIHSIINYLNDDTNLVNDSVLSNTYSNINRFQKNNKNGRLTFVNSYDALSYILETYNARIAQVNNRWTIVNKNEKDSYLSVYPNVTGLSFSKSYSTRTVNLMNKRSLLESDVLSKVSPVHKYNITFLNKNVGDNILNNGYFEENINDWYNYPGGNLDGPQTYDTFEWQDGKLYVQFSGVTNQGGHYAIVTKPFQLEALSTANTINFKFDFKTVDFDVVVSPSSGIRYMWVELRSGSTLSNTVVTGNTYLIDSGYFSGGYYNTYTEGTYEVTLNYTGTGYYFFCIKSWFEDARDWKMCSMTVDNVYAIQSYESDTTYDKFYSAYPTNKYNNKVLEKDIYFSDGLQNNDIGNLKYYVSDSTYNLTTKWSNSDLSILDQPFAKLYAYEKLKTNYKFRNYLQIAIENYAGIDFDSIIKIHDRYYRIIGWNCDLQNTSVELTLIEILGQNLTLNFSQQTLLSIDGEVE